MSPEFCQRMSETRLGRPAWNKGLRTGYAPWRGKKRGPHSAETRAKMSAAQLGRKKSAEHAAAIAAARIGARHRIETRRKIRATQLARGIRGPIHPSWGKSPPHRKRVPYAGRLFRSTFEARFARALDRRGIAWEYEPRRFDLGACTYLPDFYLPETGAFWEVKGWFGPRSQRVTRMFRERYPDVPLVVATEDVLHMMEAG